MFDTPAFKENLSFLNGSWKIYIYIIIYFFWQSEVLGRIQMAINDIAEKCHKEHDPPLETMSSIEKLHLIMVSVVIELS